MSVNEKKKYYSELNIFRGIIIIWVIIGHSFDAYHSPGLLLFLHKYAYSFHMPAFFLLSGFLFYRVRDLRGFHDKKDAILKKAKRLLIPYYFSTLLTLILKMGLESYAKNPINRENLLKDILLGQNNPNGGLWFLYVLFLISVIAILLNFIPTEITCIIIVVFMLLKGCGLIPRDIGNLGFLRYCAFYFLGMLLYRYYDVIAEQVRKIIFNSRKKLFVLFLGVLSIGMTYLSTYIVDNLLLSVAVIVINIVFWYFLALIADQFKLSSGMMGTIGDYGMDIYMISYYVQQSIMVVLGKIMGIPYVAYSIMMFVGGLVIPIFISKYFVRKNKLLSTLLLGS